MFYWLRSIARSLRALFTQSHLILERLNRMPDITEFRAAVAAFKQFLSDQFDSLDTAIKADIDAAIAGLPEGVPQEVIDAFTDLQGTVSARIATSESAAAAEVPAAPVAPVADPVVG